MADEEKTETTEEETPAVEAPEAEAAEPQDAPASEPADEATPEPETAAEEPAAEEPAAEKPAEEPAAEEPAEELAAEAPHPQKVADDEPDAPAAEAKPAPEPNAEDELPWKERRRLERSRRPSEPAPALSPSDRAAARLERRRAKAVARRRYRQSEKADRGEKGTPTPPAERTPNAAKERQGVVLSDKADKTITVRIDITRRHPTYEKIIRRSRTLHAHDERNEAGEGDIVRVVETRPVSRLKRWRLVEVIEKAK